MKKEDIKEGLCNIQELIYQCKILIDIIDNHYGEGLKYEGYAKLKKAEEIISNAEKYIAKMQTLVYNPPNLDIITPEVKNTPSS
jgi:hypothetical protein